MSEAEKKPLMTFRRRVTYRNTHGSVSVTLPKGLYQAGEVVEVEVYDGRVVVIKPMGG